MKRIVSAVVVLCLVGVCCGCSGDRDELSEDQLALFDQLNEVLESVSDATSLDVAIPKLESLNGKFAELAARSGGAGKLTKEQREKGIQKYGQDLVEQGRIASAHIVRILKVAGIKKEDKKRLQDAIKDIDLGG